MPAEFAPLFSQETQFQAKSGRNNTGGWLRVFLAGTDDAAETYSDYSGTRNPERIVLDDNGRAVVICDSARAYRLEVYSADGALLWTEEPVYCSVSAGGGVAVTRIMSSDGSIAVDSDTAGSITTYDLSAHVEDSTDLLNWIRCDGGSKLDGTNIWKPAYSAGTMLVGTRGILLDADQYYHVTARVRVNKSAAAAYYDDLQLLLKTDDGNTVSEMARKGVVVDASMGLYQDFEISADVLAGSDCELLLEITGKELDVINFQLLDMEVHRVYSGAPHLPPGTLRAEQADWTETDDAKSSFIRHKPDLSLYVTDSELDTILDGYATTQAMDTALAGKQNVLTAGSNIVIENDVISATAEPQLQANWNEGDSDSVQYIQNKPDLSVYATTQAMNTALAGKQDVLTAGSNITIDANNVISASAAPQQQANWNESDTSSVQYIQNKPDLSVYATTQAMNTALAGKQDTISDLDAIRSGAQAGSTAVQPAALADYQEKLTAGSNVQISAQNVISATDTTYTAGNGLTLSGTEFAIDTSVVATKSDIPEDEIFYVDTANPDYDTSLAAYNAGKTLVLQGDSYTGYLCRYTPMDGLVFAYNLPWTVSGIATATQVGYLAMRKVNATGETYWYGFSSCAIPNATREDSGKVLTVSGSNVAAWTSLPDLTPYVTDTELSTILQGYQEALTAGSNIQISNGTISATDTTYTAGTGLELNGTEFSVDNTIRAGAAAGATAVQPGDLATVAVTGSYNDLLDKPTIPTVPVQDVEVNGSSVVNAQGVAEITIDTGVFVAVYGTSTMAQVTAAYDAGKDIVCRYNDGRGRVYSGQLSSFAYGVYTFSTTDGFTEYDLTLSPNGGDGAWAISSKSIPSVDSSYDATSTSAQSGVAVAQALADYTPTSSLSTVALTGDYDDLLDKPTIPVLPGMKDLVAGSNISITETPSTVTIAATAAPQLQANWNESDSSSVQYVQNKPAIPVLPAMKELVAGSGVTITEGSTDVTISAAGTTYTAGTGIDITNDVISADTSVLALKSELPVIGTVTL